MFRMSNLVRATKRKGYVSSLAFAAALASGGAVMSMAFAAPAQAQSDAPQYSKNFAKAAQKASEDLNAARAKPEVNAEVLQLVDAIKAVSAAKDTAALTAAKAQRQAIGSRIQSMTAPQKQQLQALLSEAKNADEKYVVGEYMAFLGSFSADYALQAQGIKTKLDSGALKPESVAAAWDDLGQAYYDGGFIDEAHAAYDKAYGAGNANSALYAADVLYQANRGAESLDYLEGVINARTVAGVQVPQTWYGTGVTRARALGDQARLGHWAGLYASRANTPESWNAGIRTLFESFQFGVAEKLDAYRLMDRTDSLLNESGYAGYIDALMPNGAVAYPGETVRVAKEAQDSGAASQNPASFQRVFDAAKGQVDRDKASLPSLAADARKAANGADALDAGNAYLSYDMSAEAEEMLSLALTKGGIDSNLALTRLGIAQVDQGKLAEARANFAKVSGARAPIAAMWLAYLDTKSS